MTPDEPKEIQIDCQPHKKFILFRRVHGRPFGDPLGGYDTVDDLRNYRWRQDRHYCVRVMLDGKLQYLTLKELELRVGAVCNSPLSH